MKALKPYIEKQSTRENLLLIILFSIGGLLSPSFYNPVYAQSSEKRLDLNILQSIVSSMDLNSFKEIKEYYKVETKITNNTIIQYFKQQKGIYRNESKANFIYNFNIIYRLENSNTIVMTTSGTLEKKQHPELAFVMAMDNDNFYPSVYTLYITAFMIDSAHQKGMMSEERAIELVQRIPENAVINFPVANLPQYIHTTVTKVSPFKWNYAVERKISFD